MEQSRKIQYLIGFAVSLASLTAGVMFSWLTTVIPKFYNNESGFTLSDNEILMIVISGAPGLVAGTLGSHYPCDHFGRRFTLLMSAAPYFIGSIFVMLSTNHWMICVARFMWSIGFSIIQSTSMIYLTEVASKEIRGRLTVVNRFIYNLGVLIVITVGSFVSYQTLNYVIIVLPFIYFFACYWILESPYFLLKEGKIEAAREVLMKLNGCTDDQILEQRLSDMRKHVKEDMRRSTNVCELFRGKRYRKALVLGFGLRVFQVISGSIPVQYYLGRIIQETESSISIATGLISYGAIRLFVSMISSTLVDKVGRRPLLVFSFAGSFVMFFIVGVCFIIRESFVLEEFPHLFGDVIFCGVMCLTIISTVGYDTLVFFVVTEFFPLNVKSIAVNSVQLLGSVATVIILAGYQLVKDMGGLQTVFLLFGMICLAGAIFSYCLIPETKGKSLKEIQIYLQGSLYDEGEMENHTRVDDEETVIQLVSEENKR